jgi:hypothetical protein
MVRPPRKSRKGFYAAMVRSHPSNLLHPVKQPHVIQLQQEAGKQWSNDSPGVGRVYYGARIIVPPKFRRAPAH